MLLMGKLPKVTAKSYLQEFQEILLLSSLMSSEMLNQPCLHCEPSGHERGRNSNFTFYENQENQAITFQNDSTSYGYY